ncbi:MAG: M56 family metallopeptidase [Bacteroidia bacterium]
MINFILTSIFLSGIAWLVYVFFIRNKVSLRGQKGFIYFSISASLLLPLTVASGESYFPAPNHSVKPLSFGQRIEPTELRQYCRCENPDYSHRIRYRANTVYNFLFDYKLWLEGFIASAVGILLLHFCAQVVFLMRLAKNSNKERVVVDGQPFFLLFTRRKLGIGAFRLTDNYIIWQEDMKDLPEDERKAVFLHELSHLHQYNTLEKAILRIIQCIWFANPGFYFFRNELDFISECIADSRGAQALSSRNHYAGLLLKMKSLQHVQLVQHFKGNVLRRRIEMLIREPETSRRFSFYPGILLLLIAQLMLVRPVSAQVSLTLHSLETYEEIYHKITPGQTDAIYCTDCETVCSPEH